MARPTKSNVLFLQMLGRGMRRLEGKKDCLVLDFVDVVKGEGLVSLPTLLGLDPDSVLNSKGVHACRISICCVRDSLPTMLTINTCS